MNHGNNAKSKVGEELEMWVTVHAVVSWSTCLGQCTAESRKIDCL